jgi:hypothetical protein
MFPCMRTSHLQNGASTRFNVEVMTKKIEIEVPDDFYELLEEQAAAEGRTLAEVVKSYLGVKETTLSWQELSARIKARGPSKGTAAETVRFIREGRGEI